MSVRVARRACRQRSSRAKLTSAPVLLLAVFPLLAGAADAPSSSAPPGAPAEVGCPTMFDSATPLSLANAVDIALCNNSQIRGAWENIRVEAAAVGQAKAAYYPSLSVVGTELNDRTGYPGSQVPGSDRTDETVYGSLAWHLFDFGGRAASMRSARALLAAAVETHDATVQTVLSSTVQAYFDAVTGAALIEDRQESETVARGTLLSAQRKQTEGDGSQSDVLQAATALAKASLELNRAVGAYQKALADLVYTLGLPANTPLILSSSVDLRTGMEDRDLDSWIKEAERQHPAIESARDALEAARAQVSAVRSSGRPTVDLGANYYQNGFPQQGLTNSNTQVTTVGLSISVPLFDGFATHYKIRGAEAVVKVKEAQLQDTEQLTLAGVVKAHADAESSLRNLSVSEELLSAAQAALESAQRRYTQGASSILELLTIQATLADAKGERVRCQSEWRSARLRLLASAGVLSRTAVTQ
jgi:outer membrane protein